MQLRLFHFTQVLVISSAVDFRIFANIAGVPSISFLEISTLLALIALVGVMGSKHELRRQLQNALRRNGPVVYYFCWAAVSSGLNFFLAIHTVSVFRDLFPGLVLFFFIVLTVRRREEIQRILTVYLVGAGMQIAFSLSQIMFGGPRPVPLSESVEFKTDIDGQFINLDFIPTGLFSHPNGLALFLNVVNLLLFVKLFYGRASPHKRLAIALMLSLSVYILWSTQGKGALIWFAIGTLIASIPSAFAKWRGEIGWACLVVGISAIILVSQWLNVEMGVLGTMITRIQLSEAAIAVLKDNWIVVAIGGGDQLMFSYSSLFSNMEYPSSHNGYLDQVLTFGLPALVIYLIIVKIGFRRAVSAVEGGYGLDYIMLGRFLHGAMVAQIGVFFFEPSLAIQYQAGFFFLMALGASLSSSQAIVPVRRGV